jgi:uncharacterized membrane protein YraQ (UPF0718 family)
LPLFSGIRTRGAGFGPAIAFLYSGPALDIPPLIYTFALLGGQLGWGALIGTPVLAIVIGLTMGRLFPEKRAENEPDIAMALPENTHVKSLPVQLIFFGLLLTIMILTTGRSYYITLGLLAVLAIFVAIKFTRDDVIEWLKATWQFIRSIIPLLLIGAGVAALVAVLLPETLVSEFVGGNGILACFISSLVGSLLYFCSLQQVPFIRALMDLGMGKGPALALELTGAAVSLPCMLVLVRVMGFKRTAAYIGLVVGLATAAAYVFGLIIG